MLALPVTAHEADGFKITDAGFHDRARLVEDDGTGGRQGIPGHLVMVTAQQQINRM